MYLLLYYYFIIYYLLFLPSADEKIQYNYTALIIIQQKWINTKTKLQTEEIKERTKEERKEA